MSNPAFSTFNLPQKEQNMSLSEVYNKVRNSKNPDETMKELLCNNPSFRQIMTYINQNGGDARTAFYNMAAQKGVNPDSILNQLR